LKVQSEKFVEKTLRRWMKQLIEALMYVHSKGSMHRDIKPSNILLFGDIDNFDVVDAKLSDFGSGVINEDMNDGN
jgi:serine/threonine protein kinase